MSKIVVFDSGLGSLSVIKEIQKITKSEIIYFADKKNFPYGKKSKIQLKKIICKTIHLLLKKFSPDLLVIASNTPSLLLENTKSKKIITVLPPLKKATKLSKTKKLAILGTQSVIKSKELQNYITKTIKTKKIKIIKINASPLVELVESGKFLSHPGLCQDYIKKYLRTRLIKNQIDCVLLSSTHLPFLLKFFKKEFPQITFVDPAKQIAMKVKKQLNKKQSKKNSLKVFASKEPLRFQKNLAKLGIRTKVKLLIS